MKIRLLILAANFAKVWVDFGRSGVPHAEKDPEEMD